MRDWGGIVMKMREKILLFCLTSTLLALILQTILFQNASSSLIYSQEEEQSSNSLKNMQNEIYTFVKSIESDLIEIYNENDFERSLKNGTPVDQLREEYYRLAYNFAADNFNTSDGVVALYIYNINHEIISTYRRAVTPKHNYPVDIYTDPEQYNSEIVKDYILSNNTMMLISSYYNLHRETNIVRFALKIYDSTNTKSKVGYIVCDIDSKVIKNIMLKYCNKEEMFLWLQPYGDRPVLSVGTMADSNQEYYNNITAQIQRGRLEEGTDIKNKPILFQVDQNKYDLTAYSMMPQSLLKQNQKALTLNLILIAAIMSVIIILLSILITRSLTKPLEKLTKTITEIKAGNTRQRVEIYQEDEIGKLGQEFNEMLDEIERLISYEYETKLLLNKAEYKALQAQINPHFLYNTLDIMSSIASVQNCSAVSELCQSLSNIFRYSLDFKHPYSTVAKEIMHLKNYIYVMNVRMGENVEYLFNISEEILQDSIPRISIQPIIENALKHGLRNIRGEKKIVVEALEIEGKLQIVVIDNGIGMDAEQMNTRLEQNSLDMAENGTSIGLYNINARLKMLYGEEYGLHIESKQEEGTRVYLVIPRLRVDEVGTWQK
jgi:sensor histidine kinase YesM